MQVYQIGAAGESGGELSPQQAQRAVDGLGKDAFMKLLLAQLQHQDPLQPMEDRDFIAQLAQFNSLSELTQINQTLQTLVATQSLAQGSALIGKTATGLASDGLTVSGVVSGLRLVSGRVLLSIDGKEIPLERVNSVQG